MVQAQITFMDSANNLKNYAKKNAIASSADATNGKIKYLTFKNVLHK